jgi:phage terminase large subunit GpA-like protein
MQLANSSTPQQPRASLQSFERDSTRHWRNSLSTRRDYLGILAKMVAPPPTLTVSQWSDQHRKLSSESSAEPGQWRTDRVPYLRGIMDAAHTYAEVVVMKSAQVGWTEALNNTIGYHIDQDPAPILLLQPTLEMAESWSKDRLAPMIRDSPRLNGKVADPKARDSGNTLLHKLFTGGHLTIVGANSPAGLASRPIRILLCDEVDRFPVSAGTEGDPIDLARRRTARFRNRKILMGSTPTVKGVSRIESAFEHSDQRYYFVPCPHCQEFQRFVWAQVKWDDGKPETAHYVCMHCGALLTDADKPEMLRKGEWRGTKDFSGVAGFHISELYSPWATWSEIATAFVRAKRLPETLKTFINTVLGETWEEAGTTVEPGSLLERREQYGPENIPDGVLLLTVGGDVQDDRVELQLIGWGADEESWPVEQKVFRGDPGKPALWAEVDQYLSRTFTTEDGRELFVEAACIDSGGHHTQAVYQFVVSRKRRRVWAIKGMAGAGKLAWPKKASRTAKSRANVFILGVDTIKGVLYGRLGKITEPGPGYIHLPASADEDFCSQLTSERAITKYVRGRPTTVYEVRAKNIAQEVQDCWIYGYAAMLGRGGQAVLQVMARRTRAKARKAEVAEPVEEMTPPPVERPVANPVRAFNRNRGSWVKGWRY